MDDPETFEVVLGLKDSCSRRGGWLKIGDWKTGHRTESMSSDFWNLYEELEGQIPDEPARKSSGEGSSDFFADNDCEILHTMKSGQAVSRPVFSRSSLQKLNLKMEEYIC
ncbi:hypothetical protein GQ600_22792 [Phytophthora cactorum]|nr:hypothetical protein GQ600_22792 [Phytophthora cactorum]